MVEGKSTHPLPLTGSWGSRVSYIHTYVEITVPLDTNIETAYREKEKKYIQLISAMQQQYRGYKFSVIVIAAEGLGCMPKNLELNLKKLGLKEGRINPTIERIQKAPILGTVKICITVLNM